MQTEALSCLTQPVLPNTTVTSARGLQGKQFKQTPLSSAEGIPPINRQIARRRSADHTSRRLSRHRKEYCFQIHIPGSPPPAGGPDVVFLAVVVEVTREDKQEVGKPVQVALNLRVHLFSLNARQRNHSALGAPDNGAGKVGKRRLVRSRSAG